MHPKALPQLKKGAENWRRWRDEHSGLRLEVVGAELESAKLARFEFDDLRFHNCNLNGAILNRAKFTTSEITNCDFTRASFHDAKINDCLIRSTLLDDTDFTASEIYDTRLWGMVDERTQTSSTSLRKATFERATLRHVTFTGIDLSRVNFKSSLLESVTFDNCKVDGAFFERAQFSDTRFLTTRLSGARGLENVIHRGPSILDIDSLIRSGPALTEDFLIDMGFSVRAARAAKLFDPSLSAAEVTDTAYSLFLFDSGKPIQLSRAFISYAHADAEFVDGLHSALVRAGVRCWRDIHDLRAGRLEKQIDRAIRLNPLVLIVLSRNSVLSDWVEWEVASARRLEKETGLDVLCPIALDSSWKDCAWPGPLREQIMKYNVLDFSRWQSEDEFKRAFSHLQDGIALFYRDRTSTA